MSTTNSAAIAIYPLSSSSSVYNSYFLYTAFGDYNSSYGTTYATGYALAYSFSQGSSSSTTPLTYGSSTSTNNFPYTGGFTIAVNNYTFLVTPITALCLGPSGSTSNYSSTDFAQNSTTAVGEYAAAYCGPSFVNYLGGDSSGSVTYNYIYYFH